jgi:hypothetical protein
VSIHPDCAPTRPVRLGEAMAGFIGAQCPL